MIFFLENISLNFFTRLLEIELFFLRGLDGTGFSKTKSITLRQIALHKDLEK